MLNKYYVKCIHQHLLTLAFEISSTRQRQTAILIALRSLQPKYQPKHGHSKKMLYETDIIKSDD